MKRGFLNTEKAKRKLAAEADVTPVDKGKGKAKEETSFHTSQTHPYPLLDLHSAPPSVNEGKRRFIFRRWPRDPNGKTIVPSDIHGKEAANGLNLWGATLYDFYYVRRIPDNVHGLTISTGSKLAKVMESFGELEFAQDELAWVSREAEPREILAWDPAEAIVVHERHVHANPGAVDCMNKKSAPPAPPIAESEMGEQTHDVSQPASFDPVESRDGSVGEMKGTLEDCMNNSSGETDSVDNIKTQPLSSDVLLESPFHPSYYPSPWPLVPFETPCSPFPLQRGIPIHLLPKKLHVHDPWNLASAEIVDSNTRRKQKAESWGSKTDHIHTYTLSLPPESQRMAEVASNAAAAPKDELLEITIFPRETEGPTERPAISIYLKRPQKSVEVPEAHLYISPKGRLGTGNHSIVYEADLELPRNLFCESTYCQLCLDEQVEIEVDRLKKSGEWERRLNEGAQKYGREHSSATASSSSQTPPRYVGFVTVRLEREPLQTISMVAATDLEKTPTPPEQYARVSNHVTHRYVDYHGLEIPIYPKIQWQDPSIPETLCAHEVKKRKPVPRTTTFRVAAKLSFPGDLHLAREATNYLKFPMHFFQHWSGYNVVPPLHDPTPVGALVPQFFGYYTPDTADDDDDYQSPILLIEHCGQPICVDELSEDDRQECAALLFRFHCAGWLHESFAERNIVMQKRHPTHNPLEEDDQPDSPYRRGCHSFRLIDFGRSVEFTDGLRAAGEESRGRDLFGLLG